MRVNYLSKIARASNEGEYSITSMDRGSFVLNVVQILTDDLGGWIRLILRALHSPTCGKELQQNTTILQCLHMTGLHVTGLHEATLCATTLTKSEWTMYQVMKGIGSYL